jgi:putative DNA methylase
MSDEGPKYRKKLIEVALPLEAINAASAREKAIRHGHPSTLHPWWARRPLAACRAVLFAQLVDDPSSWPERYPTEETQGAERKRLHDFIGGTKGKDYKDGLVAWENSNNEVILSKACWYIARSLAWGRGEEPPEEDDLDAVRHYLLEHAPPVYDPFCGGGSIPLEAQRLGLRAYGSDLNPVAVMISKALVEFPPKFAGRPPVNPEARKKLANGGAWNAKGAQGLAEDVRYYGKWMRDEAQKQIGHLYPQVDLPPEHGGGKATVIAWLWARTVTCSNPACRRHTPLLTSFVLSSKRGNERYVVPVTESGLLRFRISRMPPSRFGDPKKGLKRGMSGIFECVFCGAVTERDYVAAEGEAGRLEQVQTAVVAQGQRERIYLEPSCSPLPNNIPAADRTGLEAELAPNPRDVWCRNFGLKTPADLFTPRQLVALTTLSDLVLDARAKAIEDARTFDLDPDPTPLADGGSGAQAYADAVTAYLAICASKETAFVTTQARWRSGEGKSAPGFGRQALPMVWDFAEVNPFGDAGGSFYGVVDGTAKAIGRLPTNASTCLVEQANAAEANGPENTIVCTDHRIMTMSLMRMFLTTFMSGCDGH